MFNKILKKIHNFFLIFGLNVSFVKKDKNISTLFHNSQEGMDKFWANTDNQKLWKNPELLRFYKLIVELLKSKKINLNKLEIADIGCGTGNLLLYINKEFEPAKNYGFEFSRSALDIATNNFPNAEYSYFDILSSKTDSTFDFIFCTEVLEHIPDPYFGIQNIVSMLRSGGSLLITVPNGRKDTFEGHTNFWSPESWSIFVQKFCINTSVETGKIEEFGLYALISKN